MRLPHQPPPGRGLLPLRRAGGHLAPAAPAGAPRHVRGHDSHGGEGALPPAAASVQAGGHLRGAADLPPGGRGAGLPLGRRHFGQGLPGVFPAGGHRLLFGHGAAAPGGAGQPPAALRLLHGGHPGQHVPRPSHPAVPPDSREHGPRHPPGLSRPQQPAAGLFQRPGAAGHPGQAAADFGLLCLRHGPGRGEPPHGAYHPVYQPEHPVPVQRGHGDGHLRRVYRPPAPGVPVGLLHGLPPGGQPRLPPQLRRLPHQQADLDHAGHGEHPAGHPPGPAGGV